MVKANEDCRSDKELNQARVVDFKWQKLSAEQLENMGGIDNSAELVKGCSSGADECLPSDPDQYLWGV
jgi:hypothetical protein